MVRDPETELFDTCRELGIGFVACGPLGHGFLTGGVKSIEALGEKDVRRHYPRFEEGNFEANLNLLGALERMPSEKGYKTVQLALA